MTRTLVIGIGNPVRADDAVGLHVARQVRTRLSERPDGAPQVDVEELWAGGLRLVEAMCGYDHAIVVDALADPDLAAGSLREMHVSDLGACRNVSCAHDTSLPTALALWRQAGAELPTQITVFGICAEDLVSLREELPPPIEAALPGAIEAVLAAIQTGQHV